MNNTVAMLVTDEAKPVVEAFFADLTPQHIVGFIRRCCPLDPEPTPTTPHTHWYMNDASVSDDTLAIWQPHLAEIEGLITFIAVNADNPLEWAYSNLASQGLRFVPDPEV